MSNVIVFTLCTLSILFLIPKLVNIWSPRMGPKEQLIFGRVTTKGLHQVSQFSKFRADAARLKVAIVGDDAHVDLTLRRIELIQGLLQKMEGMELMEEGVVDIHTDGMDVCENGQLCSDMQRSMDGGRRNEQLLRQFLSPANGQRLVRDWNLWETIIDCAVQIDHNVSIGSGSASMAQQFASLQWQVTLMGSVGPEMKNLLSKNIHIPQELDQDQYHVILHSDWNNSFINRDPERLELHSDRNNLNLNQFHQHISNHDVLILSLNGNINDTLNKIAETPVSVPYVHFELSSKLSEDLYLETANTLFPLINSLGLNEKELGILYEQTFADELSHYKKQLISTMNPSPDHVIPAIMDLLAHYPSIHRIHFHCLPYHLIIQKKDSPIWSSSVGARIAVASSSLTVSQAACGYKELRLTLRQFVSRSRVGFDTVQYAASLRRKDMFSGVQFVPESIILDSQTVLGFETKEYQVAIAPVLVCQEPVRDGLGDVASVHGISNQLLWLIGGARDQQNNV